MTSRAPGRRPGPVNSRDAVLAAARHAFADHGYAAASLRSIAAEAGVDAAMVRHFFGNKAGLFRAAMELPVDLGSVVPGLLAAGLDGVGERLVRFVLTMFDSAADRNPFISLIRSAVNHEESARMFREFMTEQLLGPVAVALPGPQPRLRASFVASQLAGLVLLRYVIGLEPLASADPEAVVVGLAPTVQRYLTGDLPLPDPDGAAGEAAGMPPPGGRSGP